MNQLSIALIATAAACGSSKVASQHARVGTIGFDIDEDWHRTDSHERGLVTTTWTPEQNERKESIVVLRSDRQPATIPGEALTNLLVHAQPSGAKVSRATAFSTASGLTGARVEAEFVPPGLQAGYHRVHVVTQDGASLVHVLYTVKAPGADSRVLDLVLRTLRHEES